MRRLLYIVILSLCLFSPVKRLDIAKLEPVEAVAVVVRDGVVHIRTDTQSEGKGSTAEEALKALKENAPGIIYLDTARFLLVGEDAWEAADDLEGYLHSNIRIAPYRGTDVKEEAKYLDAHDLASKPWG